MANKFHIISAASAENASQCTPGTSHIVFGTMQDYFQNIDEVSVFTGSGETLTIGTVVYTDLRRTTYAGDFIFNGLHYVLTDGEITSIEDYGIDGFSDIYSSCGAITPLGYSYYFRADGLLDIGNTVYNNVDGLTPASWSPLTYSSFVYNNQTFDVNGSGVVTGSYLCGT